MQLDINKLIVFNNMKTIQNKKNKNVIQVIHKDLFNKLLLKITMPILNLIKVIHEEIYNKLF